MTSAQQTRIRNQAAEFWQCEPFWLRAWFRATGYTPPRRQP